MTNEEFNNEFDVLYNNITSNQAPGLDEYEKSVFLTKAQDEIVKAYFNPKTNKVQEGFDGNERRQIDFSMLIRIMFFTEEDLENALFDDRPNTRTVPLPDGILMFINEYITVTRKGHDVRLTVIPINYNEYNRLMSKPYKRPLKYNAWRLLENTGSTTNMVELIVGPNDTITQYTIRYVKRPRPIVLVNLDSGLTVGGQSHKSECELDPILHTEILQRAVELAKAAYIGDLQSQVALGQASQTNMGIVTQSR